MNDREVQDIEEAENAKVLTHEGYVFDKENVIESYFINNVHIIVNKESE